MFVMRILVNEHLHIRPLNIEDAPQFLMTVNAGRAYLRQWLLWVDELTTLNQVEMTIKEAIEYAKNGRGYRYGVFMDSRFIGVVEVKNINRFSDNAQIGYWLAEEWQGKGIMTDCVRALTTYCFNELGLHSVSISCADANQKSRAVPERLRFVQEGRLRDCMRYYGVFYDEIIYGALKRDWNAGTG